MGGGSSAASFAFTHYIPTGYPSDPPGCSNQVSSDFKGQTAPRGDPVSQHGHRSACSPSHVPSLCCHCFFPLNIPRGAIGSGKGILMYCIFPKSDGAFSFLPLEGRCSGRRRWERSIWRRSRRSRRMGTDVDPEDCLTNPPDRLLYPHTSQEAPVLS